MNKQLVYIAGPMRGLPEFNFPAFRDATEKLREAGFDGGSPHEMNEDSGFDSCQDNQPEGALLREFLKRDCEAVLECDVVAALPNWRWSPGAMAEVHLAKAAGIATTTVSELLTPVPRLLALTGPKGVGKTTYAKQLKNYDDTLLSFADPIRWMLEGVVPDDGYLNDLKEEPVPGWRGLTGRRLLQTLGTEWGRELDPDFWVRIARKRIEEDTGRIIFDDLRFPNEAMMVRDMGGEVWALRRSGFEAAADAHVSEAGIPDHLIDRVMNLEEE